MPPSILPLILLLLARPGDPSGYNVRMGACELLNRAAVEAIVRRPVSEGKPDLTGPGSGCTFTGEYGEITISTWRFATPPDLQQEIRSLLSAIPGSRVREITGIDGHAFFLDLGKAGGQLHLLGAGGDYLMVSVLGFGDARQAAGIAREIAEKALTEF